MKNTILITKIGTTNLGNQALSDEVIKLFVEQCNGNLKVVGRSSGLFAYSIEKLEKCGNPTDQFEKWVDELIYWTRYFGVNKPFVPSIHYTKLTAFDNFKVKQDKHLQRIKNVFRKHIHFAPLFAYLYKTRLSLIAGADVIYYSGAGEVSNNNILLRQLIELRVAQKLGIDTYAINQSIEVTEEPILQVYEHVYSKMKGIVVRGNTSVEKVRKIKDLSVPVVESAPDTAWLNPVPSSSLVEEMRKKYNIVLPAVGINSTDIVSDPSTWHPILDHLSALGYNLYFVTNDPMRDNDIGTSLAAARPITPILDFIHYHEYSAVLANFKFLISCRLHSNELALSAGTPIVPIEGHFFKTTEVLKEVNYPLPVIRVQDEKWVSNVISIIDDIHLDISELESFANDRIDDIRNRAKRNYLPWNNLPD